MKVQSSMKVWIYLSGLSLVLMLGGLKLGDRHGLLAGFLIALSINALIFFFADLRLQKRFRSEALEGQDPYGLLSMLQRLSTKAAIPTPRLHIVGIATPTTLSFGMAAGQSAVLVSEGLLEELTRDEIEAAIALEVARLKLSDTVASTAAAAATSAFAGLAWLLDGILFFRFFRRDKSLKHQPVAALLFPLIAFLTRLVVGRKQFYQSDALAASLIENPKRIAEVLWKLESFQNTRPFDVPVSDVSLFVVSPLSSSRWYRKFQPQPPMERRIKTLLGYYPL